MKLSKTILFITLPIAFVFTAASITLMCWADFTTIPGFWLMLLGIALFAVSLSYMLYGINSLIDMKTIGEFIERNEKKVLHALTTEYKEFEFYGLDCEITDLISSKDNVKCLAKIDEDGYIHYKITIEEVSYWPAPCTHFLTNFKVPEPNE